MANTIMNSVSNALDMHPLVIDAEPANNQIAVIDDPIEDSEEVKQAKEDFNTARENLQDIIEKGGEALDGIMNIAKMSESPRAYEVVANLMKTMLDANKDLLELHNKKQEIVPSSDAPAETSKTVTNNNLFVGSTADLQEFMEKLKYGNQ